MRLKKEKEESCLSMICLRPLVDIDTVVQMGVGKGNRTVVISLSLDTLPDMRLSDYQLTMIQYGVHAV